MVDSFSGGLEQIASFPELYKGYREARKGKRYRGEVLGFSKDLESNLHRLSDELFSGRYRPKGFKKFKLYDPKERSISAPYFRDRVVHRSLHYSLEPFFDQKFIEDSYACRRGKGTHAGVDRAQEFMRKQTSCYFLKCDVKSYFDSVDHGILLEMLDRQIRDERITDLIEVILADSGERGLPIGTLYSQLFANVYLNEFDHFVKQSLGAGCYVRYMDDFVFFSYSKQRLHELGEASRGFLKDHLNLDLPYSKTSLEPVGKGLTFLGYRIFPDHKLLRKRNKKKFRHRLKNQRESLKKEEIEFSELKDSIDSWKGHAQHADTEELKQKYIGEL
jgi:retron-type reverse transcriptase